MMTEYGYDTEGRLSGTVVRRGEDETVMTKSQLHYEQDGWELFVLGPSDEILQKTKVVVDDGGNPVEIMEYDSNGQIVSRLTKRYDSDGNVIETVSSMPAADLMSRTRYNYDEKRNIAEEVLYNKLDEPVKVIRHVYEYFE